jgi:hypothetical protein
MHNTCRKIPTGKKTPGEPGHTRDTRDGRTRANGSHGRTSLPSTQTQRHKPARKPRPIQQPQEQPQARRAGVDRSPRPTQKRPPPAIPVPVGSQSAIKRDGETRWGFLVSRESVSQSVISRSRPGPSTHPSPGPLRRLLSPLHVCSHSSVQNRIKMAFSGLETSG